MRCPGNRGSSRKAGVQVDEPPDSGGDAGPDDLHDGLGGHAQQRELPHEWCGPGHAQHVIKTLSWVVMPHMAGLLM